MHFGTRFILIMMVRKALIDGFKIILYELSLNLSIFGKPKTIYRRLEERKLDKTLFADSEAKSKNCSIRYTYIDYT